MADSVEDTDSVKQPLNHEDLSSTGNTSHANSSSSSSNSRNPSISTVEISMVSPKSDDSTIPVETGDKQETENDNIMTREQSLAPVEQEVITADTVVENTDETTMSMLTNEPPVVTPAVTKKVVRRKKSASALPARSSSTVPRRRKQRNMSVAQNKASKKNSSSSQYVACMLCTCICVYGTLQAAVISSTHQPYGTVAETVGANGTVCDGSVIKTKQW